LLFTIELQTPLHLSIVKSEKKVLEASKALLERGADVTITNARDQTVFDLTSDQEKLRLLNAAEEYHNNWISEQRRTKLTKPARGV